MNATPAVSKPEELVTFTIRYRATMEEAQSLMADERARTLSWDDVFAQRDALEAQMPAPCSRSTQAEALCAETIRAARLLHFADGDCDPQFGKALAWLSEIAIGNSFTELERRSLPGVLEDATHARERAESALHAVKQTLEEIQMIASGAIGPNCGAGPELIRIAGQAETALDTIRRLASVPPVMNSDAAVRAEPQQLVEKGRAERSADLSEVPIRSSD